jgi:hypothetical protein
MPRKARGRPPHAAQPTPAPEPFTFVVEAGAEPGNILPALAGLLIDLSERESPELTDAVKRNRRKGPRRDSTP